MTMIGLAVFTESVVENKKRKNVSSAKHIGYHFALKRDVVPK